MLLAILFAMLPLSSASPAASAAPLTPVRTADEAAKCPDLRPRMVQQGAANRPRNLIELPPGRLELTVYREVDGCPIPAVLREGVGEEDAPARR